MCYIYICIWVFFVVVFRCIKPQLKSFALGIYTLAIRVLGKYNPCFQYGSHYKYILNAFLNIFTELLHITKWCRWSGSYYFYFLPSFLPSHPPFLDFSRNIYREPMLYQCYIKWFCESNDSFLFNNLVISSIGLLSKNPLLLWERPLGERKGTKNESVRKAEAWKNGRNYFELLSVLGYIILVERSDHSKNQNSMDLSWWYLI